MTLCKCTETQRGIFLPGAPCLLPLASNNKTDVCSPLRLQVLVIRLRDSIIKMGEELTQAVKSESQQRESSQYYQRRLEELKADMEELVQREAEASRRCMELVSAVPNAGAHLMEDF